MGKLRRSLLSCVAAISLAVPLAACSETHTEGPVAIVVLDSFHDPKPDPAAPDPATTNCWYPLPSNEVGSKGGGDTVLPPGVHHGDLVLAQLKNLLDQTPGLSAKGRPTKQDLGWSDPSVEDRTYEWSHHSSRLLLVGVDTDYYTTTTINENLKRVVQKVTAAGIQRIVVNMSFVVAPCDMDQWLNAAVAKLLADADQTNFSGDISALLLWSYAGLLGDSDYPAINTVLKEYACVYTGACGAEQLRLLGAGLWQQYQGDPRVRKFVSVAARLRMFYQFLVPSKIFNDRAGLSQAVKDVLTRLDNDPIKKLLTSNEFEGHPLVLAVGAAGNGLDLADPPSGTRLPVPQRLPFPYAPAMWNVVVSASASTDKDGTKPAAYSNSGEVMLDGHSGLSPTDYEGTSFAAPRLAVAEASYLLNGGSFICQSQTPALGYSDYDGGHPQWSDETLSRAITSYCGDFDDLSDLTRSASPTNTMNHQ